MSKQLWAVFGAGGAGRGVMPLVQAEADKLEMIETVFIDDALSGTVVNGRRCLDWSDFISEAAEEKRVSVAISNSDLRRDLVARCMAADIGFLTVRSAQSVVMDDVEIGEGAIISPFCVLTSNIRIGRHFHCNIGSFIEHDCVIGDFVTFAPGVRCNGNIHIEDGAYIGSGALIRQGRPGKPVVIGEGATVGMGAVVLNSVPKGAVLVGNPAKSLACD